MTVAVSCAPHGTCAAGGLSGSASSSARAFVVSQIRAAASATNLRLSARTIRAGHERRERLIVRVSPGTPYELALVTAVAGPGRSRRLCLVTIRAGVGSCRLESASLPAGRYRVTAHFLGNSTLPPSSSPARALRVDRAHGHRRGAPGF